MDELEFDRLLGLYKNGLLTGKEKQLVEDWLNSMDKKTDEVFTDEDQSRLKHKILHDVRYSGSMMQAQHEPIAIRWSFVYKIAATMLLIVVAGFAVWQFRSADNNKSNALSTTSSGTVKKVTLTDGTLVWLKGNSTLEYPAAFSGITRNVSLHGEALFEVAKNPEKPFVIQCDDLKATVLGTSFNIRTNHDNIEVLVLTGQVSLTMAGNTKGIVVIPNEKGIYDRHQRLISKRSSVTEEKTASITGTQYGMSFEDTPMREVINRIESKFDVTVTLADAKLYNCMITADLSDQSLKRTLSLIAQALGWEFKIENNQVSMHGKGCD